MIDQFRRIFSSSGIPNAFRSYHKKKGSFVALFHGIHKEMYGIHPKAQRDITVFQFENILQWLDKYFDFITPDQFFNGYKGGVLLTFDDGLQNNYLNVLPILEKYKAPSIFFIPTQHIKNPKDWLWFIRNRALSNWDSPTEVPEHIAKDLYDGMNEEQLIEMSNHPLCTIGSHTLSHPDLTKCSEEILKNELLESKIYLENLINKKIEYFAHPQGLYDRKSIQFISRYYKYSFAVDSKKLGTKYHEISRISVHDDDRHYLNLKFSGLHKRSVIINN